MNNIKQPPRTHTSRLIKIGSAAAIVFALLVTFTLVCSPDPQPPVPGDTGQFIPPEPVQASSTIQMAKDDIDRQTGEYLALTVWAENALRTAHTEPALFHRNMFTTPNIKCVNQFRDSRLETPDASPDTLFDCARNPQEKEQPWNDITPEEREARARRAIGLLAMSMDPPTFISANIAANRGLKVNSKTDPDFASFAAVYDTCQIQAQAFAQPLARAGIPQDMAQIWVDANEHLESCFSTITQSIFRPLQP